MNYEYSICNVCTRIIISKLILKIQDRNLNILSQITEHFNIQNVMFCPVKMLPQQGVFFICLNPKPNSEQKSNRNFKKLIVNLTEIRI